MSARRHSQTKLFPTPPLLPTVNKAYLTIQGNNEINQNGELMIRSSQRK